MGEQQVRGVRRYVALAMWLVAAGAAAVIGLDPDGFLRS